MNNELKSKEHIQNKTTESLIWYSTLPLALHLVRFANSIILARILLPSDLGVIGLVSVILYYCDTLTNLGFASAIIQRKEITNKHYHSFFTFNFIISMAFFVTAQFSAQSVALFFNIPEVEYVLPLYSGLFIISAFAIIPTIKLKRSLEFKTIAIIDAVKVAVSMSVSLTLALKGFGFWAILFASLISQVTMLILLFILAKHKVSFTSNFKPLKQLLNFSSWSFVNGQCKLLSDNLDKVIVGKQLGATELGFYDKAMGLMKMPAEQISARLGNVSFASLSRFQSQPKLLFVTFKKLNTINNLIMLPIFVGLIWTSEPLVLLLLGNKWLPIVECMQILGVSYIFSCLAGPKLSLCLAIGKVKLQTMIRAILTCLLIAFLITLDSYSIIMIAVYITIYNACIYLTSVLLIVFLHQSWSLTILKDDLAAFFPSLVMCISLYMLETIFNIDSYLSLLIFNIAIGASVYVMAILLTPVQQFQVLANQFWQFTNNFKKKFQ